MPVVPQYSDVQFGFDVRTAAAIDRRLLLTAAEMDEGKVKWQQKTDGSFTYIPLEDIMPDIYIAQCSDDMMLYIYDKNDTVAYGRYNHGKFKLLTKVVDVVSKTSLDSEGRALSLVDADGVVHIYDAAEKEIADLKKYIDEVLVPAFNEVIEKVNNKADIWMIDSESNRAKAVEEDLQRQIDWFNNGPYITQDWTSLYDVGGVGIGQSFKKGTSLMEIVRQILVGDPAEDNIIFFTKTSELPEYMTSIPWTNAVKLRSDLVEEGFKQMLQLNNQLFLIALPRKMIKTPGGDPETNPVELEYISAPDNTEFRFDWSYIDIKRTDMSSDWGYRVYYPCHRQDGQIIPSKSTGNITRLYSFKYHDPADPDPEK